MRSVRTLPSLVSLRRSGAGASRNCCASLPIRPTNECLRLCADALPHWVASCSTSRSRFWISIGRSWRSIAPTKRANDSIVFLALDRCWQPLWSPVLPIPKPSDRVPTSQLGSGWCPSRTQVEGGTGSAVSAKGVIAICAVCSWPAHLRSSAMPRSTAPNIGSGLQRCWSDDQPKSWPSRRPINSPEWPGQ
jgi:hypothetical protein